MLISAGSENSQEGDNDANRWIIGALTDQGVENKDTFYGISGNLFAICPVFRVFSSSGMGIKAVGEFFSLILLI